MSRLVVSPALLVTLERLLGEYERHRQHAVALAVIDELRRLNDEASAPPTGEQPLTIEQLLRAHEDRLVIRVRGRLAKTEELTIRQDPHTGKQFAELLTVKFFDGDREIVPVDAKETFRRPV